jgi:hypothetical protein
VTRKRVLPKLAGAAILVTPNAAIAHLVPKFLANRKLDVAIIIEMLSRKAYVELRSLAHNLTGTGGSYGCDGISDIGRALEDAAEKQDPVAVRDQAGVLKDYLRRVKIAS